MMVMIFIIINDLYWLNTEEDIVDNVNAYEMCFEKHNLRVFWDNLLVRAYWEYLEYLENVPFFMDFFEKLPLGV